MGLNRFISKLAQRDGSMAKRRKEAVSTDLKRESRFQCRIGFNRFQLETFKLYLVRFSGGLLFVGKLLQRPLYVMVVDLKSIALSVKRFPFTPFPRSTMSS